MIHQRKLLHLVSHYRPSSQLSHSGLSQRIMNRGSGFGSGSQL